MAAATKLLFSVQPPSAPATGATWSACTVRAVDANGALDDMFVGEIAVTLGNPGATGTLGGTSETAAVAGESTFSDLTYDKHQGVTLIATSPGLTSVHSMPVFVTTAGAGRQQAAGSAGAAKLSTLRL